VCAGTKHPQAALPNLLIVAPSQDLRQSLKFAFEAEGYQVAAVSWIDDLKPAPGSVDCTIVDHHAVEVPGPDGPQFCADYSPVVLLANLAPHALSGAVFRTVQKPLLGATLSFAVRIAVSSRTNPT